MFFAAAGEAGESEIRTGVRRLGAWFGWQPSEIMSLPFEEFRDIALDEMDERNNSRQRQRGM